MKIEKTMLCPCCGREMETGELATWRGDTLLTWLPENYFKKHWFSPYGRSRKLMERENAVFIKANRKVSTPPPSFLCRDCGMVLTKYR